MREFSFEVQNYQRTCICHLLQTHFDIDRMRLCDIALRVNWPGEAFKLVFRVKVGG